MSWESEWSEWEDAWGSCLGKIRSEIDGFAESAGIEKTEFFDPESGERLVDEKYAKEKFGETANWWLGDMELSMESENWPGMGATEIRRTFSHLMERPEESVAWWCDKAWGVEEKEPREIPKGRGEELGQALWDVFERGKEEFFAKIPVKERRRNANACKKAVGDMTGSFELCMKGKVKKLR